MRFPGITRLTIEEASDPVQVARAFNDFADLVENALQKGLDPINNSNVIYLKGIEVTAGGNAKYDVDGTQPAAGVTPAEISQYGREYFDLDTTDLNNAEILNVELLKLQEIDGSPNNGYSFRWRINNNNQLQARIALSGFSSTPAKDYPYPTHTGSKRKMLAWILITGGENA